MADKGMKKMDFTLRRKPGRCSVKISRLFSGKSCNRDSLTVGTTEIPTVFRMTIGTATMKRSNRSRNS